MYVRAQGLHHSKHGPSAQGRLPRVIRQVQEAPHAGELLTHRRGGGIGIATPYTMFGARGAFHAPRSDDRGAVRQGLDAA